MIPLTPGEYASMRQVQFDALFDECTVLVYANAGDNSIGEPVEGYTEGETYPCSFDPSPALEVSEGQDVVQIDARVRLPMNAVVKARDRIRIEKIAGESVTPVTYEVIGALELHKTTRSVNLRFTGAN